MFLGKWSISWSANRDAPTDLRPRDHKDGGSRRVRSQHARKDGYMGLQDRDYSRDSGQDDRWWAGDGSRGSTGSPFGFGGSGTSITVTLIIINVVVFFLDMLLSGSGAEARSVMAEWLEVRADTVFKPWQWHRLLGYGFVHSNQDIWHLAFNMLGLFIFGRTVEPRMGRTEYLRFYLVAIVLGGLVASLHWSAYALWVGESISAMPMGTIGASGAVMAVTILFAFYYPDATILVMMLFPIKAWIVAVAYVAMNLFGFLGRTGNVAYDVHLAGIAWAAVYYLRHLSLESTTVPGMARARDWVARKPNLRLHDPEKKLVQQEAEVDRILDKIQATGIDSLTKAERRTLERHSRLKRSQRSQ